MNPIETVENIFETYGPKFKTLNRLDRVICIIGILISLLLLLIILGHIYNIIVSIGPVENSKRWVCPELLFILFLVIDLIIMPYCAYRWISAQHKKPISPDKLTVHVVLPTNRYDYKEETLGDGLLQAAGFLAASRAFENISIVAHDHQNDEKMAWRILEGIIDAEINGKNPICVVFTMSSICNYIHNMCNKKMDSCSSSIKERLSILFTVASAPETPHNRENYFQHFVTGDTEKDAIVTYCKSNISKNSTSKDCVHKGLLFVMNSTYPKKTAERIFLELKDKIAFNWIELDSNNMLNQHHRNVINRFINETTVEERFTIIIAYDDALLKAIEALNQAGYAGIIIASTPLSVRDWQEYLNSNRERYWNPDKMRLFYTKTEGFNPDDSRTLFAKCLNKWSFDSVIAQNQAPMNFYNTDPEVVKKWFSELHTKVYTKIHPNYISAFCFDSVRLFSLMQKHNMRRLSELLNCTSTEINQDSPFSENELFGEDGETKVPVEMGELLSYNEEL